eukprot:3907940-Rhodomonas_salina.2
MRPARSRAGAFQGLWGSDSRQSCEGASFASKSKQALTRLSSPSYSSSGRDHESPRPPAMRAPPRRVGEGR